MGYEIDWTTRSEAGMKFYHSRGFNTAKAMDRFKARVEQREDFYGYGDWTFR